MKIPSTRYPWSRNMLNPSTPSSAYYVFFGGAGYVNPEGYAASHQMAKTNIIHELKDTTLINLYNDKAMSFQQLVYEDVRTRK